MLRPSVLLVLAAISLSYASEIELNQHVFSKIDTSQTDLTNTFLPLLTLPYAKYRASDYDANADIYTFRNIRYAAPPVGRLRWRKPQPPNSMTEIQDGSIGSECVQAHLRTPQLPDYVSALRPSSRLSSLGSGNEDCLFLDVYVPGHAFRTPLNSSLSTVVWLHGGAYIFGAKDQVPGLFYDGTAPITVSENNIIFITGNYRLGAYGFLAGDTMEKDGLPNAGLHDQRAIFQWVQDYVHLLGGNKKDVSAWGESAGGGSILHHLIANGGTLDPLFHKVVTQSAAFHAVMFDRKGTLESTFQNFTDLAGCGGKGLDCLRDASASSLATANQQLQNNVPLDTYAVGPAADGTYVRQVPSLEFASGHYWKAITSMIVSHVADESSLFTNPAIQTDAQFNRYLSSVFNDYVSNSAITNAIRAFYPIPSLTGPYLTQFARLSAFVRDSSFTCNQYILTNAFAGKTYNLQYSVSPGIHGSDLLPLFLNDYLGVTALSKTYIFPLIPGFGSLAKTFQSYFTSHARSGNPNKHASLDSLLFPAIKWPHPELGDQMIANVMDVSDIGFSLIVDDQVLKSHCMFQQTINAAVTNCGGYAVPGTAQSQNVNDTCQEQPSHNFVDQCDECRVGQQ